MLQTVTRIAAVAAIASVVAGIAAAELKGDYKIEYTVDSQSYGGTAKATPGAKGEFTATLAITSPTNITGDMTGKTFGDSISYDSKYADKDRGCTGTISAKGTVEKDGSKATGAATITDSCSGTLNATFRIWR
jgi:hypothetical protein